MRGVADAAATVTACWISNNTTHIVELNRGNKRIRRVDQGAGTRKIVARHVKSDQVHIGTCVSQSNPGDCQSFRSH